MTIDSSLVSRLTRFMELTPDERHFIARMEADEEHKTQGDFIQPAGERCDAIHVVKQGWAVVRSRPVGERPQILRIYLPGEVIGLVELGPATAAHAISMQTDGVVSPVPRRDLAALYTQMPRLAALLTALGSLDQIAQRDRMLALSRMTAEDRMIDFMLGLRDRLSVANRGLGNRIYLPFSQAEIAEALGLTSVYVNKVLGRLVRAGRIEVERPYVRLLDRQAMERQVGFRARYSSIDTSWFPAALA